MIVGLVGIYSYTTINWYNYRQFLQSRLKPQ